MTQTENNTATPAASPGWETLLAATGEDCNGNAGVLITPGNHYISNIYNPPSERWWNSRTGERGTIEHRSGAVRFIPTTRAISQTTDLGRYTITITARPEDTPVRGNVSCFDEATDTRVENSILDRLENGEVWAWCIVEVNVYDRDSRRSASAFLGGCSYDDECDFVSSSGYYEDMVEECIRQIEEGRE